MIGRDTHLDQLYACNLSRSAGRAVPGLQRIPLGSHPLFMILISQLGMPRILVGSDL